MKPFIRRYSYFGDDNYAKLDAAIRALEEGMDENDIDDEDTEANHEIRNATLDDVQLTVMVQHPLLRRCEHSTNGDTGVGATSRLT